MKKECSLLQTIGSMCDDDGGDVRSLFENGIDPAREQQPLVGRDERTCNVGELLRFDLCILLEFRNLGNDFGYRLSNLVWSQRSRLPFARYGSTGGDQ